MCTSTHLQQLQRRAYAHTVQDGLTEIFAAVMLFASAGILSDPKMLSFLAPAMIFVPLVVDRLKQRLTYPRVGYVELGLEPPKRMVWGMFLYMAGAILVMAMLLLVAGRADDAAAWRKWAPLLAGVLFGGGIHYVATQSGLIRFHVMQVISLTTAALISWWNSGNSYAGVQLYCLVMSAVALVVGVGTLIYFLRRYPATVVEGQNHVGP